MPELRPIERPILFSGPMVRATLDGNKTQTRRVVDDECSELAKCPYGQPGDILWVRETWQRCRSTVYMDGTSPVAYRADGTGQGGRGPYGKRWRASVHMPRWASRLSLRIVDVRVEQVQSISEAAACAEGVEPIECSVASFVFATERFKYRFRDSFKATWDSLNAKRGYGWEANPWVWVITFEKEAKP